MPYASNSQLPPAVRAALPDEAQTIFRKAFDAAFHEYNDEATAFRVAWAAVKKSGYKKSKKTGEWHKVVTDAVNGNPVGFRLPDTLPSAGQPGSRPIGPPDVYAFPQWRMGPLGSIEQVQAVVGNFLNFKRPDGSEPDEQERNAAWARVREATYRYGLDCPITWQQLQGIAPAETWRTNGKTPALAPNVEQPAARHREMTDCEVDAFLDELEAEIVSVIQDAADQPLRLRILLTRANVRNRNRRVYPRQVLADMVDRMQPKIQAGELVMEEPHPHPVMDAIGRLLGWKTDAKTRGVSRIDACFMQGNDVLADTTFLDTPAGRRKAQDYRDGKPLHVSLRAKGRGKIASFAGQPTEIATFLDGDGGDWVPNPALLDAGPLMALTDSEIEAALLSARKEPLNMDELEQLKAQLKALTDAQSNDATTIAALQAQIKTLTDAKGDPAKPPMMPGVPAEPPMPPTMKPGKKGKKAVPPQDNPEASKKAKKAAKKAEKLKKKLENERKVMADQINTLTEQVKALTEGSAADKAKAVTDANQQAVKTFVDALATSPEMARFTPAVREQITSRVAKAATQAEAEQVFADAVQEADAMAAAAGLSAQGFSGSNGQAQGRTVTQSQPRVEVTPAKPYMQIIDNFSQAYAEYGRRANVKNAPDPSWAVANKPFIDGLLAHIEKKPEAFKAMVDSANMLLDSGMNRQMLDSFEPVALWGAKPMLDSTTTASLWNQPTILIAMVIQQFQFMQALQFVEGIGPDGFDRSPQAGAQSKVGSVLRIASETYVEPKDSNGNPYSNMPYYTAGMHFGENQPIPEMDVNLVWLSFLPEWWRMAYSLSADAEKALLHGPLNYQAWARLTYHMNLAKARQIDDALLNEMLQVSTEYGAQPVVNEAVADGAATFVYNAAGGVSISGIAYGSQVTAACQLLCGGTAAAPNTGVPVVRPRVTTGDLNNQGQPNVNTTQNAFTVAAVNGVTQVLGYLDQNGNIAQIPGTAATPTYAVDYANGIVVFAATATSGVDATHQPTISYSYETNFDSFTLTNPTVPANETIFHYYAQALLQMDATAATMGSAPRYMPPNLALMSLGVAAKLQNAINYYKLVSPVGTKLTDPRITSSSKWSERNGVELCKINAPWYGGDKRILLTRQGSTKYGVDTPWEIQGPYPKYSVPAGGGTTSVVDAKIAYGRELSVIATPQVTAQDGSIVNPVARTVLLK